MLAMKETFVENGIEYRPVVAGNLLSQPFLKDYKIDTDKKMTNAELIHTQGVYIGNSHFVTSQDMDWLARTLGEIHV